MTIGTRCGNDILNINLRQNSVYYENEMKKNCLSNLQYLFLLHLNKIANLSFILF